MNYKILTDSTCDLPKEYFEKHDISVLPLHINKGDNSFLDGIEIQPEDIYTFEKETGQLASTAAINLYEFELAFEDYADNYDAVIMITIGSHFSSCYQNAYLAAQDFENVYVVDSKNLSAGQGMLVTEAIELAKTDITPEELCDRLEALSSKIHFSFIVDRLDYLAKGGRCNALEALGAELLEIKPAIHIKGGQLVVGKKYTAFSKEAVLKLAYEHSLNFFEEAVIKYTRDQLAECKASGIRKAIVVIANPNLQSLIDKVKEMIREACIEDIELLETKCGCTVACHCGPTTLGITLLEN